MSVIDNEDIRGYRVGEEIVCLDCVTDAEDTEIEEDHIITVADLENEEKSYFCSRCKKRL